MLSGGRDNHLVEIFRHTPTGPQHRSTGPWTVTMATTEDCKINKTEFKQEHKKRVLGNNDKGKKIKLPDISKGLLTASCFAV